jgi:putative ABC transport system ATP-binding protein
MDGLLMLWKKNIMSHQQNKPLIELHKITKSYPVASGTFKALKDVSLRIESRKLVAITGKSGSGKSTLLNVITGIDRPSEGSILINGIRVDRLSETELASWRGKNVGVVFQFFQLLPTLTILENVMLPMDFCDTYPKKERRDRALALLEKVNIREQADKFPAALSGGQQQRVAIARALANDPPLLVADEPTGNLDSQTAISIFELFSALAKSGKTVIVVTHEREFSSYFEDTISIEDGIISAQVAVNA